MCSRTLPRKVKRKGRKVYENLTLIVFCRHSNLCKIMRFHLGRGGGECGCTQAIYYTSDFL